MLRSTWLGSCLTTNNIRLYFKCLLDKHPSLFAGTPITEKNWNNEFSCTGSDTKTKKLEYSCLASFMFVIDRSLLYRGILGYLTLWVGSRLKIFVVSLTLAYFAETSTTLEKIYIKYWLKYTDIFVPML
jgi:hypothetical protein